MTNSLFRRQLVQIALPVALQSLLASSFSIVDQVMIGQMGSLAIAGVGIGGRFASIFWFTSNAVAAAAGIMIAQNIGQNNNHGLRKSFYLNLFIILCLGLAFTAAALLVPEKITSLYTSDAQAIAIGASYLKIFCLAFIPQALWNLMSVVLRCTNKAIYPTVISLFSVGLNTLANYALIFGHFGQPALGIQGAAIASLLSILFSLAAGSVLFFSHLKAQNIELHFEMGFTQEELKKYFLMLTPMVLTDFLWILGDNIYTSYYGHIGTLALAAMSISTTVISLIMGALSGFGQAAGIMTGKALGSGDFGDAVSIAARLVKSAFWTSLVLAGVCMIGAPFYTRIYQVEPEVKAASLTVLMIFAFYAPVKTENMVLGAGVLQSGGRTKYNMMVNIFGTWLVGVPLGYLAAVIWQLPVPWVFGMISLEEVVRLILNYFIFRKGWWMDQLHSA